MKPETRYALAYFPHFVAAVIIPLILLVEFLSGCLHASGVQCEDILWKILFHYSYIVPILVGLAIIISVAFFIRRLILISILPIIAVSLAVTSALHQWDSHAIFFVIITACVLYALITLLLGAELLRGSSAN